MRGDCRSCQYICKWFCILLTLPNPCFSGNIVSRYICTVYRNVRYMFTHGPFTKTISEFQIQLQVYLERCIRSSPLNIYFLFEHLRSYNSQKCYQTKVKLKLLHKYAKWSFIWYPCFFRCLNHNDNLAIKQLLCCDKRKFPKRLTLQSILVHI